MTSASRRSVLGVLAAAPVIASGVAASGRAEAAPPGAEALREYDRYLARLAAEDDFSGVALVTYRDRPVLARAYGMADKERGVPNRIDSRFNLGSASKPFTALAIVQLAEQGRLAFDATVGTYLDGFRSEVAVHVTVHQLLTHTSGLGQGPVDLGEIMDSKAESWSRLTARLREAGLDFTPGTRHAYSSSGLDALGEIVATVSGQPFWDYVHEHIFEPAGMRHSRYYTRDEWLTEAAIAHPYMYQSDGSRVDAVRNLDADAVLGGPGTNAARGYIGSGGGGGFSTAPDLVRFGRALRAEPGKLLGPAFTQLYISPKYPMTRPGAGMPPAGSAPFQAYGLVSPIVDGQRVIGHGGGIGGGNANWSIYLDTDWVGVVLCNYDLANFQDILAAERQAIIG
jgi:CubicO group peptidase (beta-lactamase class C family)